MKYSTNGRTKQPTKIERELTTRGVNLTDDSLLARIHLAEEVAEGYVKREGGSDETFERQSRWVDDKGALAIMWQVVTIRSGIGPLLNILIIIFDWWRVGDTINQIMSGALAYLFSAVIILMFTYLALDRAEWLYETRNNRRRFSFAHVWKWLKYTYDGKDEAYGHIDQATHKAAEMGRFMRFFKGTLFLAFMVKVVSSPSDQMLPAFVMALFSLIAIVGLEKQIERQYALYRARFGGVVQTESFLLEREESYLARRHQARMRARQLILLQILAETPTE